VDKLNIWFRGIFTVAILLAAAWWLYVVASKLGKAPTKDAQGNVVDEYQRAKDVLLVVLPLVTTAIGYWFGAQGKEKAEEKASQANDQSRAIAAVSGDPDILAKARAKYPSAFRE
jgi:hypothetical protein